MKLIRTDCNLAMRCNFFAMSIYIADWSNYCCVLFLNRVFDAAAGLPQVVFPDPSADCAKGEVAVQLLYRPGHYDLLYTK